VARKARDYKAEYARRKASGIRRGQSLAEARGHKNEPAERRRRREHYRERFGASPERMSKLRREALAKLNAVHAGSRRTNPDAIAAGVRLMTAEMIQEFVLPASPSDIRGLAALSYQALILDYPELENDDERNPFWYH
jgi:hypothetical protein